MDTWLEECHPPGSHRAPFHVTWITIFKMQKHSLSFCVVLAMHYFCSNCWLHPNIIPNNYIKSSRISLERYLDLQTSFPYNKTDTISFLQSVDVKRDLNEQIIQSWILVSDLSASWSLSCPQHIDGNSDLLLVRMAESKLKGDNLFSMFGWEIHKILRALDIGVQKLNVIIDQGFKNKHLSYFNLKMLML